MHFKNINAPSPRATLRLPQLGWPGTPCKCAVPSDFCYLTLQQAAHPQARCGCLAWKRAARGTKAAKGFKPSCYRSCEHGSSPGCFRSDEHEKNDEKKKKNDSSFFITAIKPNANCRAFPLTIPGTAASWQAFTNHHRVVELTPGCFLTTTRF